MKRGGNRGHYQTGFYQEHTEKQVKPVTHNGTVPGTVETKPIRSLVQADRVRLRGYIQSTVSGIVRFFLFLFVSLIISAVLTLWLNEPLRDRFMALLQSILNGGIS